MKRVALLALIFLLLACGQKHTKLPDLPEKSDRWVNSVSPQSDSIISYIGKTSILLDISKVKPLPDVHVIAVGDDIEGVHIGAIKCMFFQNDAYSGTQFMWRGKWGCQAGRNEHEIENAVEEDGTKRYDYIYIAPVTLDIQ